MHSAHDIAVDFAAAEPMLLHRPPLRRTDSNSPVLRNGRDTLTFVSHYQPRGHTLRCLQREASWPGGPYEPVRYIGDPAPHTGKWLQSVWRDRDGTLFGWYHAEELAPCVPRLFLPHIGALRSDDEGRSWRLLGDLLRRPIADSDCTYQNGFLAGGYGDFCVVPDRRGEWFYLHYSAYVQDERLQGISVLRYPIAERHHPRGMRVWRDGSWREIERARDGSPIFGAERGWRHRDPAAFWGPAIHFNRGLGLYVMLLNRTEHGNADIVQRGVYAAFNADLADPAGWSTPMQIVESGSWYPQAIGLAADDGDTTAGARARFFMSGFSAWTIQFERGPARPPIEVTRENFAELFGTGPW